MNFDYQAAIVNLRKLINQEAQRQQEHLELIASENFVHPDVLAITGSVLTNKYAEGYPGARYYGGCEFIDQIEQLAIDYAKQIFGCQYVNVQPHSGSSANFAVFLGLLNPKEVVLGMDINAGGHLTHGTKVSFSGQLYQAYSYGVDPQTYLIDYDLVETLAVKYQPKMIIAGASNYSRTIDFARFRQIADLVGAYLFCDVSHIAGLIATKLHPNCFPYCDVMMTTTHKTLKGPRGAIIAWNKAELTKKINGAVFPGAQGGPLEHVIAAKAAGFAYNLTDQYRQYVRQVVNNAQAFAQAFSKKRVKILTGGTDNHLFTIDIMSSYGLTADLVEKWLEQANITTNKNTIPYDPHPPKKPSGLRLGTAAMTARGLKESDFRLIADWIDQIIQSQGDPKVISQIRQTIIQFLADKPMIF